MLPPQAPELSVVVLCFRAEAELPHVVGPLHDELEASGTPYELILVANYWPSDADRTPEHAAAFAKEHPHVTVVARPKAGAMGWDLRFGLDAARGSFLVYLDGDGQVATQDAHRIYQTLVDTDADVAKGRREVREDGSVRTLTSLGFNLLFRLLFRTAPLWDINGQPKGVTRAAYEQFDLQTDDWFTDAEIVLKAREAGLSIVELPVRFRPRQTQGSHVGLGTVWEFVVNMARWRLGRHPAQAPGRSRTRRTGVVVR